MLEFCRIAEQHFKAGTTNQHPFHFRLIQRAIVNALAGNARRADKRDIKPELLELLNGGRPDNCHLVITHHSPGQIDFRRLRITTQRMGNAHAVGKDFQALMLHQIVNHKQGGGADIKRHALVTPGDFGGHTGDTHFALPVE